MTDNERAIPLGYMTVGEIAKKMGVTVRTLQYYDREGLFPPRPKARAGGGCIPTRTWYACIRFCPSVIWAFL